MSTGRLEPARKFTPAFQKGCQLYQWCRLNDPRGGSLGRGEEKANIVANGPSYGQRRGRWRRWQQMPPEHTATIVRPWRGAKRLGVALEISGMHRIPSKKFILKGKQAGVEFSFGSNSRGKDLRNIAHSLRMVKECGLTSRDVFSQAPYEQKPLIRRG